MASITPRELEREIAKRLAQYSDEIQEKAEQGAKEVTDRGVRMLRSKSPERTGSYKTGWRTKKVGQGYVIYNKTDYQLTHLLEYKFLKRNGEYSTPQLHIGPVEEILIDQYVQIIRGTIQDA